MKKALSILSLLMVVMPLNAALPTGNGSCSYSSTTTNLGDCLSFCQSHYSNYVNIHSVFNSVSGSSTIYAFVGQLVWNGQTYPESGICSTWTVTTASACTNGVPDVNGQCPDVACPSGQVPANTVPELTTDSNVCVLPTDRRCSELGVDATAFVPKCSTMLDGSPTQCRNSDMGAFSIAGCPSIDCGNGITKIYPDKCPTDITCPAGWTISDLGEGNGSTCTKPLPDTSEKEPCVLVGTQPLCAKPNENCIDSSGKYICLSQQDQAKPGQTCYTVAGKLYCLNNQPEQKKQVTTTQNQDGTRTVKESITTNIKNDQPNTVERTYDANNNLISEKSNVPNDVSQMYDLTNGTGPSKTDSNGPDLSGMANDIAQIKENTNTTGFTGSEHGSGKEDGQGLVNDALQTLCGGENCAATPSCSTGNCSPSERLTQLKTKYSVNPAASGTCPAINIDLSAQHWGNHHVTAHCDLMEQVRGAVSTIMSIMIALGVVTIILGA